MDFPAVLYVFRALTFVAFATLLAVATYKFVLQKQHKPCPIAKVPRNYQLFLCAVLLLHLVPAFIAGESLPV